MTDLSRLSDADLQALYKQSQPPDVAQLVTSEAARQGVDPALALSVARAESNLNPDAISPKGAIGPMQLMPETAQALGVDPHDVAQNVRGGVAYLKQQMDQFGDPALAAAAYNAGPRAVEDHGGVPPYPETQAYVKKVVGGASNLSGLTDDQLRALYNSTRSAQTPAPTVVNPQTGKPYNAAQEATYAALLKAGKLDPNAKAGSAMLPRGLMSAQDTPNPGEWYVDTSGVLRQAPQPNTAVDMLKGAARGALDDLASTADTVLQASPLGMVRQTLINAAQSAHGGVPAGPTPMSAATRIAAPYLPVPQTKAGEYARTAGQMLPNAIVPGGVVRKVAAVALPAVGSQAAGDAAQSAGASPEMVSLARFLGGAAGGAAAGIGAQRSPEAATKPMSLEELEAAKNAAYQNVDQSGFVFPQQAVQDLADQTRQEITTLGGPKAAKMLPSSDVMQARLDALADQPEGVPLTQLDKLRSDIYDVLVKPGGADSVIGRSMRNKIDALINASDAPAIQQARDLNTRFMKAQAITDKLDSAGLRSASTYSGGNYNNAVRQSLRPLVDPTSAQRIRNLTPDEESALRQAVTGTPGQNATRYATKVLTNKIVQAPVALMTHGAGPAVMEATGTVLNRIGQRQTQDAVQRVLDLISKGGVQQPAVPRLTYTPSYLTAAPLNLGTILGAVRAASEPAPIPQIAR